MSFASRVSFSILGLMSMGIVLLSIYCASCVLYSVSSGVKNVYVLSTLRMKMFVSINLFSIGMIEYLILLCLCCCVLMLCRGNVCVCFSGACGIRCV